jgi:predicted dinucleotide-binding enzyme
MKIGIIGTGNIGATLARQLTARGDDVTVANSRGPETLTALAEQTGATPVAITDIANDRQVVILAIPVKAVPDLASAIRDRLPDDVVVVDAGNYVPAARDGAIAALDAGMVESRWTETQLRHAVVKAFNTIGASSLRIGARPAGAPDRIAAPVAGDDTAAKEIVIGLLDQLGFDGFGLAVLSLVALFVSESSTLFNFHENGYRTAIVLAIVAEAAATVFLLIFLAANGTGLAKIRTQTLRRGS